MRLFDALTLALSLAATLAATSGEARAGWWEEAGTAREVTLAELTADGERFRDVPVKIRLDVERRSARELIGVDADGNEAWLVVAAHRAPARPGSDLLVHGIVRSTTDGRPVVEVLRVTTDGDPLTPEEAEQLAVADRFLDAANPEAAAARYRGLLNRRTLPDDVRADVHHKLGSALAQLRRFDRAVESLETALSIRPDDVELGRALAKAQEGLARQRRGELSPPKPTIRRPRVRLAGPRASGGAVVGRDADPRPESPPSPRVAPPPGLQRLTPPGEQPEQTESEPATRPAKPPRPVTPPRRAPLPRPPAPESETEEPPEDPAPPRPRLSGPK